MNKALQRYLNDHLAGSEGALKLTDHLIGRTRGSSGYGFLKALHRSIEQDQQTLRNLIETAGMKESTLLRLTGSVTGRATRLKLKFDPGSLGDFEALEMLALGIQGKRLLWRILDEISDGIPAWKGTDFIQLEKDAVIQRDAVENLRINSGKGTLGMVTFAMPVMQNATIDTINPATFHP